MCKSSPDSFHLHVQKYFYPPVSKVRAGSFRVFRNPPNSDMDHGAVPKGLTFGLSLHVLRLCSVHVLCCIQLVGDRCGSLDFKAIN